VIRLNRWSDPEDERSKMPASLKTLSPALILRDGACLLLKFATLTGNGHLRVERRGLVQAYRGPGDDNNNDMYMMVTSSHAVKLEQGGLERDTVDNIINLFPH
jgi:hypothetical protein